MFTSNDISCKTDVFFFLLFFYDTRTFYSYGDLETSRNKLGGPIPTYWLCDLSI